MGLSLGDPGDVHHPGGVFLRGGFWVSFKEKYELFRSCSLKKLPDSEEDMGLIPDLGRSRVPQGN